MEAGEAERPLLGCGSTAAAVGDTPSWSVMPAAAGALETPSVAGRGDDRQPKHLVAEQLPGQPAESPGVDRRDRGEGLVERQDTIVERLLAADP